MPETIEYISNTTLIKQVGNIEKVNEATKITPLMPLGKRDVIKIIGQEKYTEMLAKEETDQDRKVIALAEVYACLCYIAPSINKVSSGAGYTKSTGFQDSRQEMMSEHELQQVVEGYRATYVGLLEDYKVTKDNDADGNPDSCEAGHTTMAAL